MEEASCESSSKRMQANPFQDKVWTKCHNTNVELKLGAWYHRRDGDQSRADNESFDICEAEHAKLHASEQESFVMVTTLADLGGTHAMVPAPPCKTSKGVASAELVVLVAGSRLAGRAAADGRVVFDVDFGGRLRTDDGHRVMALRPGGRHVAVVVEATKHDRPDQTCVLVVDARSGVTVHELELPMPAIGWAGGDWVGGVSYAQNGTLLFAFGARHHTSPWCTLTQ